MDLKTLTPIMSYNNGHDESLVDKIHLIGNNPTRWSMFFNIITLLANDYKEEVIEKVLDEEYAEYYRNAPISYSEASKYSYDILTNVCDDTDLETIISYCRIGQMLPNDELYFNNVDDLKAYFNQKLEK